MREEEEVDWGREPTRPTTPTVHAGVADPTEPLTDREDRADKGDTPTGRDITHSGTRRFGAKKSCVCDGVTNVSGLNFH